MCLGLLCLVISGFIVDVHLFVAVFAAFPTLFQYFPMQKQILVNISSSFIPSIYNEGHQVQRFNYIVFHSIPYLNSTFS